MALGMIHVVMLGNPSKDLAYSCTGAAGAGSSGSNP